MSKVCSKGIFSDSVSKGRCLQAQCQLIRAEQELYYQLLLAEKCDAIKQSGLVNQFATRTHAYLQQYYGVGVPSSGFMELAPAPAVINMIKHYEEAGVTDLCIRLVGDNQVTQLEPFIHEVVPACAT